MDKEKKELSKEALIAFAEIEDTMKLENIIKDNKIEWKVGEETYRLHKPSFSEQQELATARRQKYMQLVKDETYLFRKQWIANYKAKGININDMENKVRNLEGEVKNVLLRLAKSQEPKDIATLKQEVLKLRDEQFTISMEVTDLLAYSIEDQLLIYINSFTTYLVLEKQDKDNWIRAYKSYDEFMKSQDKVIEQAFYYINMLIYSTGLPDEKK